MRVNPISRLNCCSKKLLLAVALTVAAGGILNSANAQQCSLSPAPSTVYFTAAGSVESVPINGIGDNCTLTVVSYPSWIYSHTNSGYEVLLYSSPNTGAQRSGSLTLDYSGNLYYVSLIQAGVPSPAITSNPSNQNKCNGETASFSVAASNATSYQWYKSISGGAYSIIGGATSATHSFEATTSTNNTRYQCVVSNVSGSVTSTSALLTVNPAIEFGNPVDKTVCSNADNATFEISANGNPTFLWYRAINGGTFVDLSSEDGFSGVNGHILTVDDVNENANAQFKCYVSGTCPGGGFSGAATLFVTSSDISFSNPTNQSACADTPATFAVNAEEGATFQWEESDNISTNFSWIPGATSSTYQFMATAGKANYKYRCIVTGPCGTSQTSSYATLSILSSPSITQHPSSKSACATSSTFFEVAAINATQYQWQYQSPGSGTWIDSTDPGAITNKVTPQLVNNIKYRCIITGACSPSQTSQPATLTLLESVQVSNPVDVTACVNTEPVSFSVSANGGGTLTYQWQRSVNEGAFVNILTSDGFTGIDLPILTVLDISGNINARFQCVVSGCGNSTSNPATLFAASTDLSFSNPSNQIICPGGEAVFAVNSSNAISFQWEEKTTASSDFVSIEGATYSTYQFNPGPEKAYAQYRCMVGGNCGYGILTEPATLEFHNVSTSITSQPEDQSVCEQEQVNLTVETIDPNLLYQWQVSINSGSTFNDILGMTNATYSFQSTNELSGNKYQVKVRHPICNTTVTSSVMTLTVVPNPVLSAELNSSATSVSIGEDVNLTITPTLPVPGETWKWYVIKNDDSYIIGSGASIIVSPAVSTTYHVNANSCEGNSKTITISSIERFTDENYIYTIQPKVPMDGTMTLRTDDNVIEGITYFDGLGRPMQSIAIKSSPERADIITPIIYDAFGREARKYLPFVSGNTGSYRPHDQIIDPNHNYISTEAPTYSDETDNIADDPRPYSQIMFEPSPLNRPDKEYGPGQAWAPSGVGSNNKFIQHQYLSNIHSTDDSETAEAIIAWRVTEADELEKESPVSNYIETGGYYSSNQLFVKIIIDEHENTVREYTNKEGQVILKKIQVVKKTNPLDINLNDVEEWACTYYVYDDLGNLRFVLPPEGVKKYLEVTAQN